MIDEIKCREGEPGSGFCGLPEPDGKHGFKCPRCGLLWLPEQVSAYSGWGAQWKWFRVDTRVRGAAKVGVRLERRLARERAES